MSVDRDSVVAYFAPGSGLGHLNRALAVCLPLRDEMGFDVRIVTNSPFAQGIAALARIPIIQLRQPWSESARANVEEIRPRCLITDTFPFGLHEELRDVKTEVRIHVARRLKVPVSLTGEEFALIVEAEPLSDEHRQCLRGGPRVALSGPIILPAGRIVSPRNIPAELQQDSFTLVVHSGPEEEVAKLRSMAQPPYVVISPWFGVEYYPASNLYCKAHHIITGAGYNSMAELLAHRDRHTAVAFDRRHDDQQARLRDFFSDPLADGTRQAVETIARALSC